jgi:NADH-quinone oxidoreductase subunit M
MVPVLLLLIPLISGLALFAIRNERSAQSFALLSTLLTLAVAVVGIQYYPDALRFDTVWLSSLNSRFHVSIDGMGKLLILLTTIGFPLILTATWNNRYEDANRFYGLMLLAQAGLIGVFVAFDALLFYFFWELALIPVYFLCSRWGGEKRIAVTFKFFIYTFVGSLLMLIALLVLYFKAGQSFDWKTLTSLNLSESTESLVFWLLFIAFAIKMPVFPFHTWQPDTYEQSPTAVTMVLSGIMVKMGVFAVIRWLAPIAPHAFWNYGDNIMVLAIFGMIYASLIAMRQDDLKRLVAYSSIAHIGLMVAALWSTNQSGWQGVMIQMFHHGINIIGLWIVVNVIEQQFGTRKMSELGGIAAKAPALTILLVVVVLANVALPLTNAFVGEFMMFNGVFSSTASKFSVVYAVAAGITIILSAVYSLNMIQKVFYGTPNAKTSRTMDIDLYAKIALAVLVVAILVMGVYPQPLLQTTDAEVTEMLKKVTVK